MKVAIIKYNAGNVESVANALRRLGVEPTSTDCHEEIRAADKVIFPGVGEASSAMEYLRANGLDKIIRGLKQPVLAICLGMQVICASSEENETECIGVLRHRVRRIPDSHLKVPHIGWNRISMLISPLFKGIEEGAQVYFVHGYFVDIAVETVATCSYGKKFSAAIAKDNFHAVQFHPEKSGPVGARILSNFLSF